MSNSPLRLAFAGTPDLAATILEKIIKSDNFSIISVYTQPDKPAGRGRKLRASPVKLLAQEHKLPVKQPENSTELVNDESLTNVDVMIVVAYGMILPETVLNRPKAGCINIHTSLLPRWRGAAPIQRAIQHGDKETGITIIQMDDGIDTGPILLQASCPIQAEDTAGSLHDRLAELGGDCILETLELLQHNKLEPKQQDETGACYASKISKAEAEIAWHNSVIEIDNMIRAFNPAPIAFSEVAGQSIRIWEATIINTNPIATEAGSIIDYSKAGLDIACSDGVLRIVKLQLQGKKAQYIQDFYNGQPTIFNRESNK